jgi:hypothetical protein
VVTQLPRGVIAVVPLVVGIADVWLTAFLQVGENPVGKFLRIWGAEDY